MDFDSAREGLRRCRRAVEFSSQSEIHDSLQGFQSPFAAYFRGKICPQGSRFELNSSENLKIESV
ncbi:MAG TPA: hypothetical protein DD473_24430 [Planctomycetaceae bacterium]|nr:hypothetical protein [Planctomycetaceae bacterium]